MTPYWTDGTVTLYHGDVIDCLRAMPTESVHCVITSPPYNVGVNYGIINDTLPQAEYQHLAGQVCAELFRLVIDTGRIWVNVVPVVGVEPVAVVGPGSGHSFIPRYSLTSLWTAMMVNAGFTVRDIICWYKAGSGDACAWGSWESPTAPNMRGVWETIIVASKGQWPRVAPYGMEAYRDKEGGWENLVTNVWRLAPKAMKGHPAAFPVELPMRCIRLSTWPGETILDPFLGSGTTARAAANLGRKCIGIDLNATYLDMAIERNRQGSLL